MIALDQAVIFDRVKCTWCEWQGLVNLGEDICRNCGTEGNLMDIEQEVER